MSFRKKTIKINKMYFNKGKRNAALYPDLGTINRIRFIDIFYENPTHL